MNVELIKQAVDLAGRQSHVWIATADAAGTPHLATAGTVTQSGDDVVVMHEWFCPTTMANVEENPRVSVVVWPGGEEDGFQLVGRFEQQQAEFMMDGFAPTVEKDHPLPQVERALTVRVESVLVFRHGRHSDQAEVE